MTTVPAVRHGSGRRRRVWPWVLGGFALLVLVFAALFAWDASKLQGAAQDLRASAQAAQKAVSDRDATALTAEVAAMQEAADSFVSHASGPHWTVAGWIPWVKDQTRPLQQAARSVDEVADNALGPLAQLDNLSALEVPPIENGRIDPYVLEPYRETLAGAAQVLGEQSEILSTVELGNSVDMVRENVLELSAQIDELGNLVHGAHVAAELLPPMLGAEGERTYIVMVQNNAEPRTSGGIAGAVIELTVDDGRFEFSRYVTGESMQDRTQLVAPLTEDEERVFTNRMAYWPQNVNFSPEFPRSAELLSAFWERDSGTVPDGVIATDPVGLGYMLAGMDPVELDGIEITGENLAQVMLRDVYYEYDTPAETDVFFALASAELFGMLLSSGGDQLTAGIESAAQERRLLLWSADALEQGLLESTGIAGDFIARDNALGVFLNDGSGSKIGYFIDTELHVMNHVCTSDGSLVSQTVTLTLTHSYEGGVEDLPDYIGIGGGFVPNGEFHTNVLVMPPVGVGVTELSRDGEKASFAGEVFHGRDLSEARVLLLPGESTTLTFELRARDRGVRLDEVVMTPGAKPDIYTVWVDSSSSSC